MTAPNFSTAILNSEQFSRSHAFNGITRAVVASVAVAGPQHHHQQQQLLLLKRMHCNKYRILYTKNFVAIVYAQWMHEALATMSNSLHSMHRSTVYSCAAQSPHSLDDAVVYRWNARAHTTPPSLSHRLLSECDSIERKRERLFFKVLNSAHNTISSGANVAVKGCISYFTLEACKRAIFKHSAEHFSTVFRYPITISTGIVDEPNQPIRDENKELPKTEEEKKKKTKPGRESPNIHRVYMCVKMMQT